MRVVFILVSAALLLFALSFYIPSLAFWGWFFGSLGILKGVNALANKRSYFLSKLIHWIHAMVFEAFYFIMIFLMAPLGLFWSDRASSKAGRPILLVHGYSNNSVVWMYYRWKLPRMGFGSVYSINLKGSFRSIYEYAEEVSQFAIRIERETGRSDLNLIGHSMGGVICALYASKLAPKGKVTDLVTIGSPLKGTLVARFGIGPNARELQRNSKLLKEVRKELNENQTIRVYHVATKTDELVIPFSSELIKGSSDRKFVVKDVGHVSLLFSSSVFHKVASWLRGH